MQLYTHYILRRLIGFMIIICASLTAIVWLTQALRFIEFIVNRGLSVSTFLYLSSLILPSLLWVIIPIALFCSITAVYHRLMMESELVALRCAGISRLGILRPALLFTLGVTLLSYIIGLYLLPASYREFKDMQSFIRDNYASLLLQEGVFTSPMEGLTVYIRERDDDGLLHGMLVHDNREKETSITMMAEYGQLFYGPHGPRFLLENGNRQEVDTKTGALSLLYFERYALELGLLNTNLSRPRWRESQERYLHELFFPDDLKDHVEEARQETVLRSLRAEGHYRLTWPLYNLALLLFALVPFLREEFNRRGNPREMAFAAAAAAGGLLWAVGIQQIAATSGEMVWAMYASLLLLIAPPLMVIMSRHRLFVWLHAILRWHRPPQPT